MSTPALSASERRIRRAAKYRRYDASPRGKFNKHKKNAKRRGVPFLLTFAEWWELWEPYWPERGNGSADGYVMARNQDAGAYEVGNVSIKRHADNVAERNRLYAEAMRRPRFWSEAWVDDDYRHVHEGVEHEAA